MADKPENKFVLKPTVEEWDGKYVPISEVRYSPHTETSSTDHEPTEPPSNDDPLFEHDLGGEG